MLFRSTVQAMDMAGNVSDIYTIKNPYYKNPEAKEEESSASELPVSALPTQPEKARAAVVDYVNTAEEKGGSMEENVQPEKAQPEKADGALSDAVPVSVEEQEPGACLWGFGVAYRNCSWRDLFLPVLPQRGGGFHRR